MLSQTKNHTEVGALQLACYCYYYYYYYYYYITPREFKNCKRKCKNEYESQSVGSVAGKLLCNKTALKR